MFTGIVEAMATLEKKQINQSNIDFWFSSPFTAQLKIDQSVAHNGVCLTVVEIQNQNYRVTAINETLQKTNLGDLQIGQKVNLERCMLA
jgi:riboflavin synthase